MLFQVYGEHAAYQWIGMISVFIGLIVANEIARRSKAGGIFFFMIVPGILTVYFIAIYAGVAMGAPWALANPTYVHMNSWFHYAKLYASLAGCLGFMVLKYHWGSLGKSTWFKAYPFAIVAFNILIAVVSDLQSAVMAWNSTYVSTEGITLMGGWFNIFNAMAGIINIFCMTGWWGIFSSKKQQDMLWPDMTWVYIIAYDIWNFCYTYNCLPTHAWYCGIALLFAPTVAAFFWNKGGWIQNRAFTLCTWCMFAQVIPWFMDYSVFTTDSVNSVTVNTVVSLVSLGVNIAALVYVVYRAKKLGVNPYKHPVFEGTNDYEKAMARREA
ncbi:membrane protein [Coriobacterium glomerans PW2]|uniref:Membrane protein n=1 Tax=Coriobacterium glomerans (strain ATCC 49209 / DSM 20642 / JCM 10262 / PW2) TaxID=700015 RepID=F2NA86_CORGP|nr:DUF5692 family protein [Coriobacterium glomerans]AEB06272.1 membrane protein [Coriobacterium glomerans PW2]